RKQLPLPAWTRFRRPAPWAFRLPSRRLLPPRSGAAIESPAPEGWEEDPPAPAGRRDGHAAHPVPADGRERRAPQRPPARARHARAPRGALPAPAPPSPPSAPTRPSPPPERSSSQPAPPPAPSAAAGGAGVRPRAAKPRSFLLPRGSDRSPRHRAPGGGSE